ncbi:MAG: septum formation initiator family protein [Desulfobulbaceae bacterium]|nr:septum formation initiator family protein [Candidatus Kapabacteria bacterium]MBS3999886.1 septum formation initiator family protein [Desulfobulbaceae bacterium]
MKFSFPDLNFYRKRRWTIIGVSAILGIALIVTLSDYGLWNRFKLEYETSSLEREIIALKDSNEMLLEEIEMLKSDTTTIERVAREKYGMKKRNETVYILNDDEGK